MRARFRIFLIAFALVAAFIAWLFFMLWKPAPVDDPVRIYIPRGSSYEAVIDTVVAHHCVASVPLLRTVFKALGYANHVKPGSYVVTPDMGVFRLATKLYRGNQDPVQLTVGRVRTLRQLSQQLAAQLEFDGDTLYRLLTTDSICAKFGMTPATIIALFPSNTYEVYWTIRPQQLVDRMHDEYRRFWNDRRLSQCSQLNLTPVEVVTLASIVEEETNQNDEKETIASVYLNRLRSGMPLQADPTVKFATGNFSLRRITAAALAVESPYNTYRRQGLPPGPICLPGPVSIDAVLANRRTPYYYFCACDDFSGHHRFAASLAEHNRNAALYHKALNARGIK